MDFFLFAAASRSALRPTQAPIQQVPWALTGGKVSGGWNWWDNFIYCRG